MDGIDLRMHNHQFCCINPLPTIISIPSSFSLSLARISSSRPVRMSTPPPQRPVLSHLAQQDKNISPTPPPSPPGFGAPETRTGRGEQGVILSVCTSPRGTNERAGGGGENRAMGGRMGARRRGKEKSTCILLPPCRTIGGREKKGKRRGEGRMGLR